MSLEAEFYFFSPCLFFKNFYLFQPLHTEVKEDLASSEVCLHLVRGCSCRVGDLGLLGMSVFDWALLQHLNTILSLQSKPRIVSRMHTQLYEVCHTNQACFPETLGLTLTCICRIHVGHVVFPNHLKKASQIGENSLSSSVTLTKIAVFLQSKICMTSGSNYSFKNHSVSQHWKYTQHWKWKLINTEVSSYPTVWVTRAGTKSFLESLSRVGTKPLLDPKAGQAVLRQRSNVCMKSDGQGGILSVILWE